MRHDEIPVWHYAGMEIRYGGYIVRQELPGYKKNDGAIIIWGDETTTRLAAQAPDMARLLVNLVLTKEKIDPVKFQRDAREILTRAGVDIWDFNIPELKR